MLPIKTTQLSLKKVNMVLGELIECEKKLKPVKDKIIFKSMALILLKIVNQHLHLCIEKRYPKWERPQPPWSKGIDLYYHTIDQVRQHIKNSLLINYFCCMFTINLFWYSVNGAILCYKVIQTINLWLLTLVQEM